MYGLYQAGYYIARSLPRKVCYAVAVMAAYIYGFFSKTDRDNIKANLLIVTDGKISSRDLKKHSYALFANFAKYLVDFFKFGRFTREEALRRVEFRGVELIDKYLSRGRGLILLSLHLGNWELAGAVLSAMGYPINAIALEHADKKVNDFFVGQRALNDVKVIPLGIQVKKCFQVLKRNEVLGIVGDKDYTSNGECVEFFGRKTFIPKGPAFFALRTGAPILVTALTRRQDDNFVMLFEEPEEFIPSGDIKHDLKALMSTYLKVMEKLIRTYPDQWYAFRRVWEPGQTIL